MRIQILSESNLLPMIPTFLAVWWPCGIRGLLQQVGRFRDQQISADCLFYSSLGRFLGPQRRETRTHSSPDYNYFYLLNQSAYIRIGG